jgi:PIN domain nuclease of toxin-antitoxin system
LIYLDTHVVAWLYAGRDDLLSARARKLINDEALLVSPMVVLELEYLHETKRISVGGRMVADALAAQIGLRVCELPFPKVADAAIAQRWTRDPFDRLIVAQAATAARVLVTKDAMMRRHYRRARW